MGNASDMWDNIVMICDNGPTYYGRLAVSFYVIFPIVHGIFVELSSQFR